MNISIDFIRRLILQMLFAVCFPVCRVTAAGGGGGGGGGRGPQNHDS